MQKLQESISKVKESAALLTQSVESTRKLLKKEQFTAAEILSEDVDTSLSRFQQDLETHLEMVRGLTTKAAAEVSKVKKPTPKT